jgi:transposase
MARTRRKFKREYKAEVVKLVKESGKTLSEVCRDLDLVPSVVSSWVVSLRQLCVIS